MPVTQIPSRDPLTPAEAPEQRDLFEAQHWETAYRTFNPDDVPHLLIQLQDDLSRARKREAVWLSVILHLFVIILLWNSEKLMGLLPHRTVELAISANADRSKDATFLELPPDEQKLTRRPDANRDQQSPANQSRRVEEDTGKRAFGTAGRERAAATGAGPGGAESATTAAGESAGIRAAAAERSDRAFAGASAEQAAAEF